MSPCENCHAGCCRSFAIPLSGADIIRLETGLGLTFWEFACRWADPEGIIAQKYAPHLFFEDEPDTPFVIALLHDKSDYFDGTTRCRFLDEGAPDRENPLGVSKCGIYEHRPAACRVFPTKFSDTSELAVIHDVPERTRGDGEPVYDLCPRQWEPGDLDPVQPIHDLLIARYEMQFFSQIAELWNKRKGPWESFPDFLHLVYAQRVTRQQPTPRQQPIPRERPQPVQTPEPVGADDADSGPQIVKFPNPPPEKNYQRRRAA